MKQQVKQKWTAALTSGKFKQTTDQLKAVSNGKSSHCCLGVLCELYIKEVAPTIRWSNEGGDVRSFKGREDMPPSEVLEWAGLSKTDAGVLANLNDNGKTFAEIATVINEVKTVRWANQYGRGVKRKTI
jgi:hypothetical protein